MAKYKLTYDGKSFKTFDELGKKLKLTKQRISQLVKEHGENLTSEMIKTHKSRQVIREKCAETRIKYAMEDMNITSIDDFSCFQRNEIMRFRGLGKSTVRVIEQKLKAKGLRFRKCTEDVV